jgi:hypothetical protein
LDNELLAFGREENLEKLLNDFFLPINTIKHGYNKQIILNKGKDVIPSIVPEAGFPLLFG